MLYRFSFFLLFITICSACTGPKVELEARIDNFVQEKEYNQAVKKLQNKSYAEAAEIFEAVFLYGKNRELSLNAQIMQAYSLLLNNNFEEAEDILDNCIIVDPKSKYLDYIYYLQGVSLFSLVKSPLYDLSFAMRAKQKFQKIVSEFPGTIYYKPAKMKIKLIDEFLVEKEISIGIYYLKNLNPIAALNRFQNAYTQYSHTSRHQESIYRILESMLSLGLKSDAKKYFDILSSQYPEGYWYKHATKKFHAFLID